MFDDHQDHDPAPVTTHPAALPLSSLKTGAIVAMLSGPPFIAAVTGNPAPLARIFVALGQVPLMAFTLVFAGAAISDKAPRATTSHRKRAHHG